MKHTTVSRYLLQKIKMEDMNYENDYSSNTAVKIA